MTQKQKENLKQTNTCFSKKFFKKRKIDLKLFNKFLFILCIAMGVVYLACVNELAVQGFVLTDLKQNIKELNKKNSELELKIMMLESYNNISERARNLEMVKADNIDFIEMAPEEVAKK